MSQTPFWDCFLGPHSLMLFPSSSFYEEHSVSNSGLSHESALPNEECFQLEELFSPYSTMLLPPTDFQCKQQLQSLAKHIHPFPFFLTPSFPSFHTTIAPKLPTAICDRKKSEMRKEKHLRQNRARGTLRSLIQKSLSL